MIDTIKHILNENINPFVNIEYGFFEFLLILSIFWFLISFFAGDIYKFKYIKRVFNYTSTIGLTNLSIKLIIILGILIRCNNLWDISRGHQFGVDTAIGELYSTLYTLNSTTLLVLFFIIYKVIVQIIYYFYNMKNPN
jgi:hypothetical protein